MLPINQIRFFRDLGYLRIASRISLANVHALREFIDFAARPGSGFRTDNLAGVVRISQLFQESTLVQQVFTSPELIHPLQSLLGLNIELLLNRHNHATLTLPGNSSYRLHRDTLQWSRSVITAILYLENTSIENGSTVLVPGSHLLPLVQRPNNGGTWMDEHAVFDGLEEQALPVPMEEGSFLVFDSLLFHSVGRNINANSTRPVITMAFTSVDELLGVDDIPTRILVSGTRIYKGNTPAYGTG